MGHRLGQQLGLHAHASTAQPRCLRHALRPGASIWPLQPVNLFAPSLFHHGDQRQFRPSPPRRQQQVLGDYAGKVLLIVNVASRCGFTKQYAGLQALNEAYAAKGLAVLGFPCNDFGAQEPGSLEESRLLLQHLRRGLRTVREGACQGGTTEPYATSIRWTRR